MTEMRDVTSKPNSLSKVTDYLKEYLRHPLEKIAQLPDWSLKEIFLVQIAFSLASGFISGFFPPNTWKILQGIFFFPIITTVLGSFLSAFLYYYFQIFEQKTISFQKLLQLSFLANIFFFIFHIPANYIAFSDLIGMAMTGILMVVGLTENFQLEKKRSLRLIGLLFLMVFLIWLTEQVARKNFERVPNSISEQAPPIPVQ